MPDPIIPAPGLPPGTGAVMPVHARRGVFVPVVGGYLNVTLPGEIVRTLVEKMESRDVALVRVKSVTMHNVGHGVKTGALIAVQRHVGELSEDWVPVSIQEEQEKLARAAAERAARAMAESAVTSEPVEPPPVKRGRADAKTIAKRVRSLTTKAKP